MTSITRMAISGTSITQWLSRYVTVKVCPYPIKKEASTSPPVDPSPPTMHTARH